MTPHALPTAGQRALVAALAAAALLLAGCTSIIPAGEDLATADDLKRPTPGQVTTIRSSPTTGASGTPTSRSLIDSRTPPPAGRVDPVALDAGLQGVRSRHKAQLAVAWAPVGRPDLAQIVGSTPDNEAWSTLKVPIALAVVQEAGGKPSATAAAQMRLAITESDNATAAALWDSLGTPREKVARVLADAGDPTTRPGRGSGAATVPFGLTPWKLVDSARFAALLPCATHSEAVLDLMGRITADQAWGLGTVVEARYKGGWGLSPHGYLSRQLGVVPRADGSAVAVAVAAQPQDNTAATSSAVLSEATKILVSLLAMDDGGRCPAP